MSSRKIIHVPMEEDLLAALDARSKKEGRSRAELIREACHILLRRWEEEEMDRVYVEGYRRIPEDPALGEAQIALLGQVLPEDNW